MIRFAVAAVAILSLSACAKQVKAPEQADACFEAVPHQDGGFTFNLLSAHEATMESCAAALEGMRERFLALGGGNHQIMGVYNGTYLFLDAGGVLSSQSVDGMRFPFLVRSGDGRLVAPGAVQTQ